jgi:hypothetical protein
MATLTTQNVTRAGVGPSTPAPSAGGDSFVPDKDTFLLVQNNGSTITLTVVTPYSVLDNVALADVSISVPVGSNLIGPFRAELFADPTDGLADITYSSVASMGIAVLKFKQP